jgi:hypothetical protein
VHGAARAPLAPFVILAHVDEDERSPRREPPPCLLRAPLSSLAPIPW